MYMITQKKKTVHNETEMNVYYTELFNKMSLFCGPPRDIMNNEKITEHNNMK